MGYWKSKVLPKIKKVFDKDGKKAAAAEACKSFDESKDEINKELEEKRTELQPKIVEIYEASSVEIKTLVKQPTTAGVKKHAVAVTKFLEDLVKIEFPGSKPTSEAAANSGPALVTGPVLFIFEKVATFVVTEEPPPAEPATDVETTSREVTVEVEKKKEEVKELEEEKKEEIEKVEETPPPPPPAATETAPAPAEEKEAPKPL